MNNKMSDVYLLTLLLFVLINYMTPVSAKNQDLQAEKIPDYSYHVYDQVIDQIYRTLPPVKNQNLDERISTISEQFLGCPYILFPLGEGKESKYDQQPLYRTEAFDCLTFVETVLAIAYGEKLDSFKENMIQLRYRDGIVNFQNRNHFTSIDWNINNQKNGYIEDITSNIKNQDGKPIAKISKVVINKPNWYKKFNAERLKQIDARSTEESKQLLNALQELGQQTEKEKSEVDYLPLSALFDAKGNPKQFIFDQIPSGAIIEIVRPNGNMVNIIGTNLQISHLGFALRMNDELIFRQASQIEKKVIDIPLTDYLKNYLHSPTVKGISVWMPVLKQETHDT